MKAPKDLSFTRKTGRQSVENYLKANFNEFYIHLNENFKFCSSMNEKLYCYYNKIYKIPKCPICGNNNNFINFSKGYTKHCSYKCTQQDKCVRNKYKDTCKDKYGEDFYNKFYEKGAKTKLELYGDENYNNSAQNKMTCLERYGVENAMQSEVIKDKAFKTCKEKYGAKSFLESKEFNSNRNMYKEKSKQTCLERYGVESPMQNEAIKDKASKTCQEKYGVKWNCMREEAHNSRNSDSGPNMHFKSLLDERNIRYTREFVLNDFAYDFKIGTYLIEINPSATHNIMFNPFSIIKSIEKNYHKYKSENAYFAGYNCIHVWDWDDYNKIADFFKEKMKIYARECKIRIVNKKEANQFLNNYHLQNTCKGQTIRLGLYYNEELVQIMTFGKPRYNKNFEYELLRLCTKADYVITGGSEKLFKYFTKTYNPKSIISYCDDAKFTGAVYKKLGFSPKCDKTNQPSCHWYNMKTKKHITNNMLLQLGFDKIFNTNYGKGTDNEQLMIENGFIKIYDCGQSVYVWSI